MWIRTSSNGFDRGYEDNAENSPSPRGWCLEYWRMGFDWTETERKNKRDDYKGGIETT